MLASQASLGEICDRLATELGEEQAASFAGSLLAEWIVSGLIGALSLNP